MKKTKIAACLLAATLGCACLSSCAVDEAGKDYGVAAYRTTMQFRDGFKVMQLTDLHLGVETNLAKQLNFIVASITEADPDLIVLTGDNFMYASKRIVQNLFKTINDTCKNLTSARFDERLTKFAVTFGNHDNQGDYARYFVNEVVSNYATQDGYERMHNKYAAFIDYEDDNLFGLTNYYIDLVDDRTKSVDEVDVKYRLHIIDSNTYHFKGFTYGYDVIREEQLQHAKRIYDTATADKDYIGMAFFHIPFWAYAEVKTQYESAADPSQIGQGRFSESVYFPYEDNGSYEALRAANILSFFVGHDHENYGDFLYNAFDAVDARAIFSYGVKSTDQLYHADDMIGYKTITLRDNMSQSEYLSIDNIRENFLNVTDREDKYE